MREKKKQIVAASQADFGIKRCVKGEYAQRMKAAPLYRVNLLIERNDTYIYPQQESGNEKEKESPRGARQKKNEGYNRRRHRRSCSKPCRCLAPIVAVMAAQQDLSLKNGERNVLLSLVLIH